VKPRLMTYLHEHYDFLEQSCARFDAGHEHEAKRIALSVRVLVHDTKWSTSLLALLGIKDEIEYVNTAGSSRMGTKDFPYGLAALENGPDGALTYIPVLGEGRLGPGERIDF